MPQIDLGQVVGPQGAQGEPGPQGAQGIQGPAGPAATINGVNALTIEAGDNIELSQSGSTTTLSVPTDAAPTEDSTKPVQSGGVAEALASKAPAGYGLGTYGPDVSDLNEAVKSGFYSVAGTYQNGPVPAGEGYSPLLVISASDGGRIAQLYYGDNFAYVGCIAARRYSNLQSTWSPWEWINPPMEPGVEYRTAEKYNKAPVYCQLVNCGALPTNGTTKSVQHGISSIDCVLRAYGTSPNGKFAIPYQAKAEGIGVCANATTIYIESQNLGFDPTAYTAQVVIFYTKVE